MVLSARLNETISILPLFSTDEIGAYNRDKVCEIEAKDGCVSPVYALFDSTSSNRNKNWRCYFEDALTKDINGVRAYDNVKQSSCYKTKTGLVNTN